MLEFTEVSAMERCALCGTLIVSGEQGLREGDRRFCTPRCARVSGWYEADDAVPGAAPGGGGGGEEELVRAVDPRSGEAGAAYATAGAEQVREAVRAAARAFGDGALVDPGLREALLRAAAAALREAAARIVARAALETGLAEARLNGELERTAGQLEAFAGLAASGEYLGAIIDPADPEAKPIPRPDLRRMLVPIGPVAVFGASNFPLAFGVAGGDTAAALAAGCPVVVKGHPSHPGTSEEVAACLAAAVAAVGADPATVALLQAAGSRAGEFLVEQEELEAVAFTGSYRGGRALFERAAARPRPIPVFAEMGSLNPLVVTPGALALRGEEVAAGLAAAVSGSAGQLCTKPGLIFVPAGDPGEHFVAALAESLAAVPPQPLLNAGILAGLTARSEEIGAAAIAVGSGPLGGGPGFQARPAAYRTTATRVVTAAALREECFGPVVLLALYDGEDDLTAALRSLGGQLTATLHAEPGRDDELTAMLLPLLQRCAGRVVFDGFPTGVAVTAAMTHGGPFPATTAPARTSVGLTAIERFLRPVTWQSAPDPLLPPELRDANPRGILRRVDGELTRSPQPAR